MSFIATRRALLVAPPICVIGVTCLVLALEPVRAQAPKKSSRGKAVIKNKTATGTADGKAVPTLTKGDTGGRKSIGATKRNAATIGGGLTVAAPGSADAARVARFRALVDAGLVPVHHLGGDPDLLHQPVQAPPRHVGSVFIPHPSAKGKLLNIQQQFAVAFSKQDPQPTERVAHFVWLSRFEYLKQVGWQATFLNATQNDDGSYLMNVSVKPALYSQTPGVKTYLADSVTEQYLFANGRIELVNSNAHIIDVRVQVFPVLN